MALAGWQDSSLNLRTTGALLAWFRDVAEAANRRLGDPTGITDFVVFFDVERRSRAEVFALLAAEVRAELARRQEVLMEVAS